MSFIAIASRTLSTEKEDLTVEIGSPSIDDGGMSKCEYRILDSSGGIRETGQFFGIDSTQVLLFCLTGVGDYLRRFEPSASFVGLPTSGFPVTDLDAKDAWTATVSLPAI